MKAIVNIIVLFFLAALCAVQAEPAPRCLPQIEQGPCKASITRYGYNGAQCVEFKYGGCQGNSNRFETLEECNALCTQ